MVRNADLQRFTPIEEPKRECASGNGGKVANQLMAVAQLLRIGRDAVSLKIARRRAGYHPGVTDMPGDKRRVIQRAAADHTVYVSTD